MRVILHVDMDAFYASVEQRDRPALRGQPVVVGAPPDRRGVVAAASYEARAYGVRSGMPSRTAARLCPRAVFLPVNMAAYVQVSRQVFDVFEAHTPLVEPLSLDEAFLDVTGCRALFGDGPAIARRIRAAIRAATGLTASVGVAHNKLLAKIASDMHKPDGLTVVPSRREEVAAFLAPLPVGVLYGIGRVAQRSLHALGLRRVGDLQAVSTAMLAGSVGHNAAAELKRLALGIDHREVGPAADPQSIGREHTFDQDCGDPQMVRATLLSLSADVGRRLRAAGMAAEGVRVKLRWRDFTTITRQRRMSAAFSDDVNLRRTALELLASVRTADAVRLVGVTVFGLRPQEARIPALGLDAAGDSAARWERLSRGMDAVRDRFGVDSLVAASCLQRRPGQPPPRQHHS